MTQLWVERTAPRRYTGRSSRGAQVPIGNDDVEGVFTPGELLKIALAACSGMASGAADRDQERYPRLAETMHLDLSGLSEAERQRLLTVVHRAIDASCTVGRTLTSGTEVDFTVDTEAAEVADG